MKIILATGIFPPDIGGPATYVEKLATSLTAKGFEVQVITYSNSDGESYNFSVERISRRYPWRHFSYLLKLFKLGMRCDLLYAQNVTSAGLPSLFVSKILGKRMVLKIVGDAAWEQGKGYLGVIQKCVARHAYSVIVPSRYLKERITSWGVNKDKITVIYNAVEAGSSINLSKDQAKKKIGITGDIILSIGRLAPWKGFSDLIDLMPDLLKKNDSFRLIIAGEGDDRKNLENKIKDLEVNNEVKMTGSLPHSQMPLYFKAADIFVLNSGYEGLSHVILEAMQAGLPIIASDEGGNPELIEEGFNGFLVKYGDQGELRQAILKIWKNKDLQEKFGQNSKIKIKDFTWENLVSQTVRILKQ
jgi:glycosyltransferase involved in cell wall biosynthesis